VNNSKENTYKNELKKEDITQFLNRIKRLIK